MIYVVKNPREGTLAIVSETPTGHANEETMSETEFAAWRDAQPPQEKPQCPQSIPQYKLRLWLIEKGLLPLIEGLIDDPANWPDAQSHAEAKTRWQCVPDVQRNSQMVNTLGAAIGLDQSEIDAAFIEADKLT